MSITQTYLSNRCEISRGKATRSSRSQAPVTHPMSSAQLNTLCDIRSKTIGLCGSPGGQLAAIVEHAVVVPARSIGQQEDGHLVLNHAIATALRQRIEATPENLERVAFAK